MCRVFLCQTRLKLSFEVDECKPLPVVGEVEHPHVLRVLPQPRQWGLPDRARLVIGGHSTRDTRVQMRVDDAAVTGGPGRYCSPSHRRQ